MDLSTRVIPSYRTLSLLDLWSFAHPIVRPVAEVPLHIRSCSVPVMRPPSSLTCAPFAHGTPLSTRHFMETAGALLQRQVDESMWPFLSLRHMVEAILDNHIARHINRLANTMPRLSMQIANCCQTPPDRADASLNWSFLSHDVCCPACHSIGWPRQGYLQHTVNCSLVVCPKSSYYSCV